MSDNTREALTAALTEFFRGRWAPGEEVTFSHNGGGTLAIDLADTILSRFTVTEPGVTDEMVENAAKVLWADYDAEYHGSTVADFRDLSRAVLSAALRLPVPVEDNK